MRIEGRDVAGKLTDYFDHRVSLAELVDRAEQAMMGGDFVGNDWEKIQDIVARIGVADVRAFGLTWEDCERFLLELGYRTEVVFLGRLDRIGKIIEVKIISSQSC